MNLKEAFRYQTFLNELVHQAAMSISDPAHCQTATRLHKRSNANPDAEDITEVVEVEPYHPNDTVISFASAVIREKGILSRAITNAKNSCAFDLDAEIECNKLRQTMAASIRSMLRQNKPKRIETGKDYRFNAEGNQMPYYYEIEATFTDAFNREYAKENLNHLLTKADEMSTKIDAEMVNTQVEYTPDYNVNDTFEDCVAAYIEKNS